MFSLKNFFIWSAILIFSFSCGALLTVFNNHVVDFSILEYAQNKPSIILDDEGNELARFELDKRGYTNYSEIPKHLIYAFLSAEDRNFFSHGGISWKGIIRSSLINLKNGKIVQGASTITQQLVKLLFFDAKKTFKRKIKEQFFALLVENQFSKEQILEMYLNYIYFGCGIYGVEAASQRFFGRSVKEISIAQAATLAAVVKSPNNYCPLLNQELSKKRRNLILSLMHEMNFISSDQFESSKSENLDVKISAGQNIIPHLKETIRLFLEDKFGKQQLYTGGLQIQTTINSKIQKIASEEFARQFIKLKTELEVNVDGALISMDANTGEIKSLIGGYDFIASKFNRALKAKRQMGSVFKPIIYTAAIQSGMSFADTEIDEPIQINFGNDKWSPNNNTRHFDGKMTLARALSYSNNIISVKLLLKLGCKNIVNFARKFRFTCEINPYPSLALGCIDTTLKETIGSFNVFANDGVYVEPHFLKWVKNEWGEKIFKHKVEQERIISSNVSSQVAKVLSLSIKRYLDKVGNTTFVCESIGKTGTTNNSRTCWFCGSSPGLTTALYIGADDCKSMGENIYAVKTVFPIWLAIHEKLNLNKTYFQYDTSLKEKKIDWFSGEDSESLNAVPIFVKK